MIDGTPDLESVRDAWALMYPDHEYGEAVKKFDRWLDSVRAEVWDEGWGVGGDYIMTLEVGNPDDAIHHAPQTNPYLEK